MISLMGCFVDTNDIIVKIIRRKDFLFYKILRNNASPSLVRLIVFTRR